MPDFFQENVKTVEKELMQQYFHYYCGQYVDSTDYSAFGYLPILDLTCLNSLF